MLLRRQQGGSCKGSALGEGPHLSQGLRGGLQPPRWEDGALGTGSVSSLGVASSGCGCSSSDGSQVVQPRHGQSEGLVLGEMLSLLPWGGDPRLAQELALWPGRRCRGQCPPGADPSAPDQV